MLGYSTLASLPCFLTASASAASAWLKILCAPRMAAVAMILDMVIPFVIPRNFSGCSYMGGFSFKAFRFLSMWRIILWAASMASGSNTHLPPTSCSISSVKYLWRFALPIIGNG